MNGKFTAMSQLGDEAWTVLVLESEPAEALHVKTPPHPGSQLPVLTLVDLCCPLEWLSPLELRRYNQSNSTLTFLATFPSIEFKKTQSILVVHLDTPDLDLFRASNSLLSRR